MMEYDIESAALRFRLAGRLIEAVPFGSGHINDTFSLRCRTDVGERHYILQRINHQVFRNPAAMMENIRRVTAHIRKKLEDQGAERRKASHRKVSLTGPAGLARRQLTVIETHDGAVCFEDEQGSFWRLYNKIEGAVTYDTLESPPAVGTPLAGEIARMFGWFGAMLVDLPGPPLNETIPDFHATAKRFKYFTEVLRRDPHNRAKHARDEIEFILDNVRICDVLPGLVAEGAIPIRIAHNDAKINNVMLDAKTQKGVCVIDLDTVMPGLSLYDFGDLVRTAASPTAEDERDLSKVALRISTFEMLAKGFAEETFRFLTPSEIKHLAFSGKLITFEQMIRFLADYLAGDIYYKVNREGQNLDRSRTQMKLVQSIIDQEEAMNRVVESVFRQIDAQ